MHGWLAESTDPAWRLSIQLCQTVLLVVMMTLAQGQILFQLGTKRKRRGVLVRAD